MRFLRNRCDEGLFGRRGIYAPQEYKHSFEFIYFGIIYPLILIFFYSINISMRILGGGCQTSSSDVNDLCSNAKKERNGG